MLQEAETLLHGLLLSVACFFEVYDICNMHAREGTHSHWGICTSRRLNGWVSVLFWHQWGGMS